LNTQAVAEPGPKVSILLVDDQPSRLLSYETILRELGQNLVRAHSGAEALQWLMHQEFALILLDVSMPEMDGFETAAMIHEHPRFERTPIIFVTGVHDTEFDRLKGYKLGAVDYVSIPVVPEILRGKVSVLIELHTKRRELQAANRELAEANRALADANVNLEAEKARELELLNMDLQSANRELEHINEALQAQIAERRRVELALTKADQRKDEFLAILAHELRNPLAALAGASRLLNTQQKNPQLAVMASSSIQRQVSHMARLLDDLLDVSRISHGLMQLQMERTDMTEVVRSAIEMVRPQIDAKQQSLKIELGGLPAPVMADAVRIIQIVANLLNNAVKYTPASGHLEVALRVGEQDVSVTVRDDGVGIAPPMLEQIFDMFFQVGKTPAQGGLGVGLALVKGLVKLHNGRVHATSRGEGQGSEFVLTLPLLHEQPMSLPERAPDITMDNIGALRVLVADDNRDSATSWAALIEQAGHDVVVTFDGQAAFEAAGRFRPQVALLDIGMPEMDGYQVAQRLRASEWGKDIYLVAVTGWGQAKDRAMARDSGFDEHYTKPLDPDHLQNILRNANRQVRRERGLAIRAG
jgi:signal transduction histidine kinase